MPTSDAESGSNLRRRGRPAGSDSTETRNRILKAARRVINQRGYPAATFQAISIEANLSRPTLHYHFGSREELYETLVDEAGVVLARCIANAKGRSTLRDSLFALVAAMHDVDRHDRSQIAFLISARLESGRSPELGDDTVNVLHEFLVSIVADAAMRGELPDAGAVAPVVELLHAMLWGIGLYAGFIDDDADMRKITKQLDQVLVHGLLGPVGPIRDPEDTYRDTPSAVGGRS